MGGRGEEREGAAFLEDSSVNDEIYVAIASGQDTTTTNAKAAKGNDDEEGQMVGITQFWICEMGHMEALSGLIIERDIDCVKHLTDVTCQDFEDGTGFEIRFTFDIKTDEYFMDQYLIKRYEVPNLLLDDEFILNNVTG